LPCGECGHPEDTTLSGPAGSCAPTLLWTLRSALSGPPEQERLSSFWCRRSPRRMRSARQHHDASRSKSPAGVYGTMLTISRTAAKGGIPMICALVRDWPRCGSAAQGHPLDLKKPGNGHKGMKRAFCKRVQQPHAHAPSPGGRGAAPGGSCSTRRRQRPSAMRRALFPWGTACEAAGRLRRQGRASTPAAYFICLGGAAVS
jgi:hypothetical protein